MTVQVSNRFNDRLANSRKTMKALRSKAPDSQVSSVRFRWSAHSLAGFVSGGAEEQENQDAIFIRQFPEGKDLLIFGLLDGHGENGTELTQALTKVLPDVVTCSESWKSGNYKEALQSQIPACADVMHAYGIDCSLSGSTAVVAVLQSNCKLTVANLGDSRCFVGGICEDGECYSIPLSTDHTLADAVEAQRVRACKGWIGRCVSDDRPVGPQRMYLPQSDIPGLALTRSIGDFAATGIGLSSQPDVIQYQVRQQDRYLVLCSDGMFEFMSNRKIINSVHRLAQQGLQPEDIAARLVGEARQKWLKKSPDFIDDCSIIVVLLDNPQHTPPHIRSSASELRTTHSILQRTLHSGQSSSTPADSSTPVGSTPALKSSSSSSLLRFKRSSASLRRSNSLASNAEPPSPPGQSSDDSAGSSKIRSFSPVTLLRSSLSLRRSPSLRRPSADHDAVPSAKHLGARQNFFSTAEFFPESPDAKPFSLHRSSYPSVSPASQLKDDDTLHRKSGLFSRLFSAKKKTRRKQTPLERKPGMQKQPSIHLVSTSTQPVSNGHDSTDTEIIGKAYPSQQQSSGQDCGTASLQQPQLGHVQLSETNDSMLDSNGSLLDTAKYTYSDDESFCGDPYAPDSLHVSLFTGR